MATRVAKQFVESYHSAHSDDVMETLDLWQTKLPEFDGSTLEAKYAILNGLPHTQEQLGAWQAITKIANHFMAADKFLVSLASISAKDETVAVGIRKAQEIALRF